MNPSHLLPIQFLLTLLSLTLSLHSIHSQSSTEIYLGSLITTSITAANDSSIQIPYVSGIGNQRSFHIAIDTINNKKILGDNYTMIAIVNGTRQEAEYTLLETLNLMKQDVVGKCKEYMLNR